MQKLGEVFRVDLRHVREPLAPLLDVRTNERVHSDEVDVVTDNDEVARTERGVDAAGRVGQQQFRATHPPENLNWQHDGFPSCALIEVATSAPRGDELAQTAVQNELAAVALHRRSTESGNVSILDAHDDFVDFKRLAPSAP